MGDWFDDEDDESRRRRDVDAREGWICGKCGMPPRNNRELQSGTCQTCYGTRTPSEPVMDLPDDAIEDLDDDTDSDDDEGSTCDSCLGQILDFEDCPECQLCPTCCTCDDGDL